jgi:hypothetical protein
MVINLIDQERLKSFTFTRFAHEDRRSFGVPKETKQRKELTAKLSVSVLTTEGSKLIPSRPSPSFKKFAAIIRNL